VILISMTSLAIALVVAPWMIRNSIYFDDIAITQRGGGVLLTRAFKNQMTDDEFRGAFYVYAPAELKRMQLFKDFSHGEQAATRYARLYRNNSLADIEASESGDVDKAVSFFCKSRALIKKIAMHEGLDAKGADNKAEKLAMQMIKQDIYKHIKTTPLFAWRQLWSFGSISPTQPESGGVLAFGINLLSFTILLLMPLIALLRKKPEWLVFSLFPLGVFWFHALLSHAIPRYSAPLIPIAIISLLLLMHTLIRKQTH
jgi:hypothetical protein